MFLKNWYFSCLSGILMGKVGTLVNFRRRRIFFEDLVTNPFQNEYFYAKTWWKSSKFSRCRAKNTVRTFFIQYCSCYNTKAIFFIIRAEGAKIFGIFTFKWNFRGRQQQPFILKWNSQLSGISSTIFMHSQLSGIPLMCESSVYRFSKNLIFERFRENHSKKFSASGQIGE